MKKLEKSPEFDFDSFDLGINFDINNAFQEAMQATVNDTEIALEEKVRRMEVIVSEGTSEVYRDFVDFRQMAAQMEMFCNHDHMSGLATKGSNTLLGFMDKHSSEDGHNHDSNNKDEDEYEIDPKTGKKKKKKKKRGWFGVYS